MYKSTQATYTKNSKCLKILSHRLICPVGSPTVSGLNNCICVCNAYSPYIPYYINILRYTLSVHAHQHGVFLFFFCPNMISSTLVPVYQPGSLPHRRIMFVTEVMGLTLQNGPLYCTIAFLYNVILCNRK